MRRFVGAYMNSRAIGLIALGLVLTIVAGLALTSNHPSEVSTAIPSNTPATLQALGIEQSDTSTPYPTLATPPSITTSTNGYTLTLYPVSADASRILITYTLTAPPGRNAAAIYFADAITQYWDLLGPTLYDSDGTQLSSRTTSASSEALDEPTGISTPAPSVSSSKAIAFDRTHLPNTSLVLSLHLAGDLVAIKGITFDSVFVNPITETVARNLRFDFSLPVSHFDRIADVNQTSQVGGITLTLDQIAVTSSETVLFMHGRKDPGSNTDYFQGALWPQDLQVNTSTGQARTQTGDYPLGGFSLQHTGGDRLVMFYPGSLLQSDNQWTVSISKIMVGQAHTDTTEQHDGPWTFHFTLPQPAVDANPVALP